VSVRGPKGDISVRTLIDCEAEADIVTPSLLARSGLNHDGQRLGGYKTLNHQPLAIYGTASVPYKVTDSFGLKQGGVDSFLVGEVAGFDMVLGMP